MRPDYIAAKNGIMLTDCLFTPVSGAAIEVVAFFINGANRHWDAFASGLSEAGARNGSILVSWERIEWQLNHPAFVLGGEGWLG